MAIISLRYADIESDRSLQFVLFRYDDRKVNAFRGTLRGSEIENQSTSLGLPCSDIADWHEFDELHRGDYPHVSLQPMKNGQRISNQPDIALAGLCPVTLIRMIKLSEENGVALHGRSRHGNFQLTVESLVRMIVPILSEEELDHCRNELDYLMGFDSPARSLHSRFRLTINSSNQAPLY